MLQLRSLVALGVFLATAVTAAAQPPGPVAPPPGAPTENMSPAELHRLFDAMLVMQAQDALALNEQQYGVFVGRLRTLQETRRRNQQERGRLMNELQKMTGPRQPQMAAEADVKQRLTELQELDARTAAEVRKAYSGIDEILSVAQQARFRVLEEQIERRKLELVARARANNQQQNRMNNPRPPVRRPPGR